MECAQLVSPANGRVTFTSHSGGAIATYYCDASHDMQGVTIRICQADAQWSGKEPICKPKGGLFD